MTPGPSALEGPGTRPSTPASHLVRSSQDRDDEAAGSSRQSPASVSSISRVDSAIANEQRDQPAASSALLPYTALAAKLCTRCGQLIPSDHDQVSSASLASPPIPMVSAPSPSSIAFAPPLPSPPSQSTPLPLTSQPSLRLVSRPSDGSTATLCAACTSVATIAEPAVLGELDSMQNEAQSEALDADGDSAMTTSPDPASAAPLQPSEASTSHPSLAAISILHPSVLPRSQTSPTSPWRRPAWSPGSSQGEPSAAATSAIIDGALEAADAEDAVMDEEEYPPLVRRPTSPTSMSRGRRPISPEPTSERERGCSFSRSQSMTACFGDVDTHISSKRAKPVVLVPSSSTSMGRTRSSSSNSSASSIGRGSSGRRQSRTVVNPAGTSIAAVGDALSTVEKDAGFGPHLMTRPRLSSVFVLPRAGESGSRNRSSLDSYTQPLSEKIPAAYQRQYAMQRDRTDGVVRTSEWYNALRPDPLADATLRPVTRIPNRGRGCLFPGAVFNGTQKSQGDSYSVTVQIVNVDLPASHLCGYLNIRGLTPLWPELTTYFDAEIIGSRHGFLTGKWGATESDDSKHWDKFPAFKSLKAKGEQRFNHLNKNFVFMRWKERFLVPDHRVRDINGASFAGFYYVCVELGEDAGASSEPVPSSPGSHDAALEGVDDSAHRSRQPRSGDGVLGRRNNERSPGPQMLAGGTPGRMSGFYFHENTAPYQQLTLQHVPQRSSTAFEMR